MEPDARIRAAERLMEAFATRTVPLASGAEGARYLWTDAFAVFAFLALYDLTRWEEHLDTARRIVDRVHHVLGRHREDDPRDGWISGLDRTDGEQHPTRGGLRIGKPRPDRKVHEQYDERLEWERDGQYFHYLTKWMHALNRVSLVTGDLKYNDWALELAEVAHRAFVHELVGGDLGIFWKMSVDLARPVVPTPGWLDALDGFATYGRLQAMREAAADSSNGPDVGRAQSALCRMCRDRSWTTGDELGIGCLLTSAGELVQLTAIGAIEEPVVLESVLRDAQESLRMFAAEYRKERPAESRLAFREIGLSIGLHAVEPMRSAVARHARMFRDSETMLARLDAISRHTPWSEHIEQYWLEPANQDAASWTKHLDINAVMLATSFVPHVYLSLGPRSVDGPHQPASAAAEES